MKLFQDQNPTTLGSSTKLVKRQLIHKLEGARILGSIPIKIKRYFTDVDGVVLAKTDAGLLAAGMGVSYPVYVLSEFDRQGGYKIGGLSRPAMAGTYFLLTYVKGQYVDPIIDFSGSNTVNDFIATGDVVQVWTDNLSAPSYFVYIVQSIAYAGLGSILADTRNGDLQADSISYFAGPVSASGAPNQFNQPLKYVRGKVIGTYKEDDVNPLLFKDPQVAQQTFIDILQSFEMHQYFGICFYMLYETDDITFNIKIKHL